MPKLAFELCVRIFSRFFPTHLAGLLIDNNGKLFLYNVLYISFSNFVVGNFLQNTQKSQFWNIETSVSWKLGTLQKSPYQTLKLMIVYHVFHRFSLKIRINVHIKTKKKFLRLKIVKNSVTRRITTVYYESKLNNEIHNPCRDARCVRCVHNAPLSKGHWQLPALL